MFIKDWEIWISYKNSIEKISKNNKISQQDFKPKPQSHTSTKPRFVSTDFQGQKVRSLDKIEMKKFKSDRFIDLHGHTREIDNILEKFCIDCILRDLKFVTIITGKGSGIVREATEIWLTKHPEFIAAFSGIKDSMNQIGAYAIKLRTKKTVTIKSLNTL